MKKVDIKTDRMFRFKHVSKINVESHLRKLKRQKACGLDNLPPGLLKDAAKEIALPLSYIINLSLKSVTIPTDWKKAKLTPVYKSGSAMDLENYWPISLLCVVSKIMEKEVHSQFIHFLEEHKLISPFQFGFHFGEVNLQN